MKKQLTNGVAKGVGETGIPATKPLSLVAATPIDTTAEWYRAFVDECKTHVHVTRNVWRWEIIKARHGLGQLITAASKEHNISINNLIGQLSVDMDYAPRTLYYCAEFYQAFPNMDDCPIGESAVWQQVIDLLPHKQLPENTTKKERVIQAVATSKPSKDILKKYYEYIRRHGCVLCDPPNKDDVVDPHHFPKTRGAGAKDWHVIPLCRKHHSLWQNDPVELWRTEKDKIAAYLYDTILALFTTVIKGETK